MPTLFFGKVCPLKDIPLCPMFCNFASQCSLYMVLRLRPFQKINVTEITIQFWLVCAGYWAIWPIRPRREDSILSNQDLNGRVSALNSIFKINSSFEISRCEVWVKSDIETDLGTFHCFCWNLDVDYHAITSFLVYFISASNLVILPLIYKKVLISPTFYEKLEVWLYIFCARKFGGRAPSKMVVKLTTDVWHSF